MFMVAHEAEYRTVSFDWRRCIVDGQVLSMLPSQAVKSIHVVTGKVTIVIRVSFDEFIKKPRLLLFFLHF
jgi:hypothetical protein